MSNKAKQTVLETVQYYGFVNVVELAEIAHVKTPTLRRWHDDHPFVFEAILLHAQKVKRRTL